MKTETLDRYSKVLDIQDLMSRCMGNIDFACRVLQILSERCESDMDGLEQAAAQQDFDQVYHISHRLKGAFANASAKNMSRLADEVCAASQAKNECDSLEKTCKLRDEWDEFKAMVQGDANVSV